VGFKAFEVEHDISFHDALLRSISTDLVEQRAEFVVDLCVGNPNASTEAERERRRGARLVLTGVRYLVIEPPDPKYRYQLGAPVDIDSCEADPAMSALSGGREEVLAGRFFVSDWNSFIHFAATNAVLTWLERV